MEEGEQIGVTNQQGNFSFCSTKCYEEYGFNKEGELNKMKTIKQLEKEIDEFEQEAKEQGWSGDEEKDWISDFIGERDLHTYFELKAQLSQTKEIVKIIEERIKEIKSILNTKYKNVVGGWKKAELEYRLKECEKLLIKIKGEEDENKT